jgi:Ni2+-binding GTPase involved in maturation of urease and hydrogenase
MAKAQFLMVGGFLGAGKTTAILKIAERLRDEGRRVGLITNDQSVGLVDTTMAGARDLPVEEITGGCFCCKFNSLVEASRALEKDARPDVFLAEPVGSCTDLKATVAYPLRQMYGENYAVAPLSVLIDPVRAMRILGLVSGKSFSEKVTYIYLKQLEEADVIVINKSDLLTGEQVEALSRALRARFPGSRVLAVSARHGTNLDAWLDFVQGSESGGGQCMEVDYDTYAEGEALLGWMNCTAQLSSATPFEGNRLLKEMAGQLQTKLQSASAEVAHLKMTLTPDEGNDLAVLNLVRNDFRAEQSHSLQELVTAGELIVNLRAEIAPEFLREATITTLEAVAKAAGVVAEVGNLEAFRPGRPTPTHRLARL